MHLLFKVLILYYVIVLLILHCIIYYIVTVILTIDYVATMVAKRLTGGNSCLHHKSPYCEVKTATALMLQMRKQVQRLMC